MLGQIETGKSVPTITLIWKVARALGLSTSDLIATPSTRRTFVLPRLQQRTIMHGAGHFRMRPFVSADFETPFVAGEILVEGGHCEILPSAGLTSRAALFVIAGELEVGLPDEGAPPRLCAGDAILFDASFAHTLFNPGTCDATALLVTSARRNTGG